MSTDTWTDADDVHLTLHRLAPTNPLAGVHLAIFEERAAEYGNEHAMARFVEDFQPMIAALNRVCKVLNLSKEN